MTWDRAAAGFGRWNRDLWEPLAAPLVAAVQLAPGERVFDACCGAGSSARIAARQVGPTGQVDAVDASAQMIRQAHPAQAPGQLDFSVGDALAWTGTDYHAVLCGFGIFFLGEQSRALDSLARRLIPGGRIALSVWQGRPFEPLAGLVLAACRAEGGGIAEASAEVRNIGRVNSVPAFSAFLTGAGLQDVNVTPVKHRVRLTGSSAWSFVQSSLLVRALPSDPAAVVRVQERLAGSSAGLELHADALIGSARR